MIFKIFKILLLKVRQQNILNCANKYQVLQGRTSKSVSSPKTNLTVPYSAAAIPITISPATETETSSTLLPATSVPSSSVSLDTFGFCGCCSVGLNPPECCDHRGCCYTANGCGR
jgi:hypothetical protein